MLSNRTGRRRPFLPRWRRRRRLSLHCRPSVSLPEVASAGIWPWTRSSRQPASEPAIRIPQFTRAGDPNSRLLFSSTRRRAMPDRRGEWPEIRTNPMSQPHRRSSTGGGAGGESMGVMADLRRPPRAGSRLPPPPRTTPTTSRAWIHLFEQKFGSFFLDAMP